MSGFLHRTAARIADPLGAPPGAVRPRPVSRFEPGPALSTAEPRWAEPSWAEPWDEEDEAAPSPSSRLVPDSRQAVPPPPAGQAAPDGGLVRSAVLDHGESPSTGTTALPGAGDRGARSGYGQRTAPSGAEGATAPTGVVSRLPGSGDGGRSAWAGVDSPAARPDAGIRASDEDRSAGPRQERSSALPRIAAATARIVADGARTRADARRGAVPGAAVVTLAARLAAASAQLPTADHRPGAATSPARLPSAPPAVDAPSAPVPVEITIGRIEVRATVPQQARPEPVAPAVSTLEDYLRRRAQSR